MKRQFFAYRNGQLADMLRKQGVSNHRTVFGLNVIQLRQIAADHGVDTALARELWADTGVRESRLLAPMLAEPSAEFLSWLTEVQTAEEADILCHSLLRKVSGAESSARENVRNEKPLVQYAALRLLVNLAAAGKLRNATPPNNLHLHNATNQGVFNQLIQLLEENEESAL